MKRGTIRLFFQKETKPALRFKIEMPNEKAFNDMLNHKPDRIRAIEFLDNCIKEINEVKNCINSPFNHPITDK